MKFLHISDIHIGKRVCGYSMLEDQRYILGQIVEIAEREQPDGVLVAGDLYDKAMPSAEAVELADEFLYRFVRLGIPVWVISGNHDCAERIAYGGRMMEQAGLYMARVFDGELQRYTVVREDGICRVRAGEMPAEMCAGDAVDIYLLPYVRPAQVRRFFPDRTIETTQQAVGAILADVKPDPGRVGILVMHQFLTGASVCDSEELTVGGSDQVDVSSVDAFDYVALGHLHRPQQVGRETVRYCGSPLKYSFSEAGHTKSVTIVETGRGGLGCRPRVCVRTVPLHARLDLREIRGPIARLLSPEVYRDADVRDYLHITLTDEHEVLDAIGRLREVYPNIMRLDFEAGGEDTPAEEAILIEEKSPQELFEEFFERQNGRPMSEEQRGLAAEIWAGVAAQPGG